MMIVKKHQKILKVLSSGCPIDSDFDGIYDYKDIEPFSKSVKYIDDIGRSIDRPFVKKIEIKFDTIIVKEVNH